MASFRGGFDLFKFDVVDENNNALKDQIFYIDIIGEYVYIRANGQLNIHIMGLDRTSLAHHRSIIV